MPFRLGTHGLIEALGKAIEPAIPAVVLLVVTYAVRGRLVSDDLNLALLVFLVFAWRLGSIGGSPRRRMEIAASSWISAAAVLFALGWLSAWPEKHAMQGLLAWLVVGPPIHYLALRHRTALLARVVRLRRRHRVVVVGANEIGLSFAEQLVKDRVAHIDMIAFLDDRSAVRSATEPGCTVAGRLDDVAAFVREQAIDYVYLALPMASQPRILRLLRALRDTTASVYFVPNVRTLDMIQTKVETRAGFPVVSACDTPFRGVDGAVKRGLDLVLASLAVVVLSPVMIATALAIRFDSPGPVIFKQRRFGLDGRDIVVYKFRSMRVTEDGSARYTQVVREDPRVTRVGAFIRKTSIDELPQLFNVLQGRMSLVGPRPHVIAVNEQYRSLIEGYMVRHKVRPGITGWAQVHGFRGGDDLESMRMRVAYDIDYLRRWSPWLDLLILWRTVMIVFRDSRAY